MTTASISVIIPFYNSTNTIERAIKSVLVQTLLPCELIIIDDKSSEKSLFILKKILKKHSNKTSINLLLFTMEENSGAGEARNYGWSKSSGNYIAFLDADDSWLPRKLEVQYSFFEKDDSLMLCGHKYSVITDSLDDNSILRNRSDQIKYSNITKRKQLIKNRFATSTVMLRSSLSTRFSKNKRYSEDFLLWCEIIMQDNKSISLNAILAVYYKNVFGDSGLSSNMFEMYKGELDTYNIIYKKGYTTFNSCIFYKFFSSAKYVRRLSLVYLRKMKRQK